MDRRREKDDRGVENEERRIKEKERDEKREKMRDGENYLDLSPAKSLI